eukprot:764052-Hanusia_phi.AAC.2
MAQWFPVHFRRTELDSESVTVGLPKFGTRNTPGHPSAIRRSMPRFVEFHDAMDSGRFFPQVSGQRR